jgi:hypothetical protein
LNLIAGLVFVARFWLSQRREMTDPMPTTELAGDRN